MMIAQPRRIAANALKERLTAELGDVVGLRMGFGVKEETKNTKMFFVTTGYLVKLVANNANLFRTHTHLIIDEVGCSVVVWISCMFVNVVVIVSVIVAGAATFNFNTIVLKLCRSVHNHN